MFATCVDKLIPSGLPISAESSYAGSKFRTAELLNYLTVSSNVNSVGTFREM